MIMPSTGTHVVVSNRYCPGDLGLIIPKTEDGRVLFLLPWEGSTLIGTTDEAVPGGASGVVPMPRPTEQEVEWILREISRYLDTDLKRSDVDAAWTGTRPLARHTAGSTAGATTASLSRDHVVEVTAPRMITVAGGKWTTYRKMAVCTRAHRRARVAGNASSSHRCSLLH
jgi:glycerol-3-phosphate dehydrogenase